MFVGVVVENFHRCRIEQEREERAVRAIKKARKETTLPNPLGDESFLREASEFMG